MSIEPWEEAIQQEENEEHEWMKTEHAADNTDQPKPTTERYGPFPKGDNLRKPKPTTDEWAAETVRELWRRNQRKELVKLVDEIQQLREQLAELETTYNRVYDDREQKERQLAEAQAAMMEAKDVIYAVFHANKIDSRIRERCSVSLRNLQSVEAGYGTAALDAAIVAAQRTLVDALKKANRDLGLCGAPDSMTNSIDAALAKVKEGK